VLKRTDFVVALFIFILAAVGSYHDNLRLNMKALSVPNVWYQGDIGRVYSNMTDRKSNHYRTKVHPIFSLATNPVVFALSKAGLSQEVAVRSVVASAAGVVLVLLYCTLRLLNLQTLESLLFSVLASVSASSIFWSPVPETHLFGTSTILAVLIFTILSQQRTFAPGWYVGISALSLSMTVTNWMSGVAATFANQSLHKTIRITIDAFVVVTILWAVQHAIYPTSEFFLLSPEERHFVFSRDAGSVLSKSIIFFINTIVMPGTQLLTQPEGAPLFSIQHVSIDFTNLLYLAMAIGWIVMLALGLWALWKDPANTKFKSVILFVLAGQYLLHMVYGDETFLFSMNWMPLLIIVAAFGLTSPYRKWVIALTIVNIIGIGYNNVHQFNSVAASTWTVSIPDFPPWNPCLQGPT